MAYHVDILLHNASTGAITYVATLRNLAALDNQGHFLEYSDRLSNWGTAKFRIGTKDPILVSEGDITVPFRYHVRIRKGQATIWQGVIVNNPKRTKQFIEVEARGYLYLLSRYFINHDTTGDVNYRTFNSGTMASTVTSLIAEAASGTSVLTGLTAGTIDSPNFPAGYTDTTGAALSGPWTWNTNFLIKVDYRDLSYVLQSFGAYAQCDYQIDNNLVFNFRTYLGNRIPQIRFNYGLFGNIEDYDVGRNGDSMANNLIGIAADNNANLLHAAAVDTASIARYGKISSVAAYGDIKDPNILQTRLNEELVQASSPDNDIRILLNERAFPLGQWGIGDTVTIDIQDHVISLSQPMRIVGYDIKVHLTGKELIKVILNNPRVNQ